MVKTWTLTQRILHWGTLLLAVLQYWSSAAIHRTHIGPLGVPPAPRDLFIHSLHTWGGITILGLVLIRLALRSGGVPAAPASVPERSRRLARCVQLALYALLACLAITGLVTTYFWGGMGRIHVLLVYGLYALVTAHAAGALWHDLRHRAGLIRRMTAG